MKDFLLDEFLFKILQKLEIGHWGGIGRKLFGQSVPRQLLTS